MAVSSQLSDYDDTRLVVVDVSSAEWIGQGSLLTTTLCLNFTSNMCRLLTRPDSTWWTAAVFVAYTLSISWGYLYASHLFLLFFLLKLSLSFISETKCSPLWPWLLIHILSVCHQWTSDPTCWVFSETLCNWSCISAPFVSFICWWLLLCCMFCCCPAFPPARPLSFFVETYSSGSVCH